MDSANQLWRRFERRADHLCTPVRATACLVAPVASARRPELHRAPTSQPQYRWEARADPEPDSCRCRSQSNPQSCGEARGATLPRHRPTIVFARGEFYVGQGRADAMLQSARWRSLRDLIPSGVETVPQNTISILRPNRRFIESYMLGLNDSLSASTCGGAPPLICGPRISARSRMYVVYWIKMTILNCPNTLHVTSLPHQELAEPTPRAPDTSPGCPSVVRPRTRPL